MANSLTLKRAKSLALRHDKFVHFEKTGNRVEIRFVRLLLVGHPIIKHLFANQSWTASYADQYKS